MSESLHIDDCWNRIGTRGGREKRCERLAEYGRCANCPVYSATGRRLLNRPLPDDYQRELSEIYRQPPAKKERSSRKAFVFRAGEEWLALRSSLVNEVVDMGPIHSIPHKSSRIFRGIVNVRGRLELCVSIGGVLKIEPAPKPPGIPQERLIVAAKAGQSVVFPVSEVLGPVQDEPADIKPLPVTVSGSKAVYTRGILSLPGKDVGLLDDALLFRILTRNLS